MRLDEDGKFIIKLIGGVILGAILALALGSLALAFTIKVQNWLYN